MKSILNSGYVHTLPQSKWYFWSPHSRRVNKLNKITSVCGFLSPTICYFFIINSNNHKSLLAARWPLLCLTENYAQGHRVSRINYNTNLPLYCNYVLCNKQKGVKYWVINVIALVELWSTWTYWVYVYIPDMFRWIKMFFVLRTKLTLSIFFLSWHYIWPFSVMMLFIAFSKINSHSFQ